MFVNKNGLLAIVASAGIVSTALVCRHDTLKSEELDNPSTMDILKCYAPTILSGGLTLGCIAGMGILSSKQQTSLLATCAAAEKSLQRYRQEVIKRHGAEEDIDICQTIAAEETKARYISGGCLTEGFDEFLDAEKSQKILFYDSYSERFFWATVEDVLTAEYHLNRNFTLGGDAAVNEFYSFLGIDGIDDGDNIGWNVMDELYWIEFMHPEKIVQGQKCRLLQMVWEPRHDYLNDVDISFGDHDMNDAWRRDSSQ